MLAGRPPFVPDNQQGDTDFALKQAHMTQAPPPLSNFNPTVPPAVEALVLRALEKDPDRRFGGCGEFRRSLESWDRSGVPPAVVQRGPVPSPTPSPSLPQVPISATKSGISALGCAAAGFVLLIVILGSFYEKKHNRQTTEETPASTTAPKQPPSPSPAESGDSVHRMLGEISQKLAGTYDKTGDYYDALAPDGVDNVTAELEQGQTYLAAAVCDGNCSDLDLGLIGSNGTVIAQDVLEDDNPVVHTTAARSGKFTLRLVMQKCSAASCQYGVGLYRKR
jgi:serine/threonine protein kinase